MVKKRDPPSSDFGAASARNVKLQRGQLHCWQSYMVAWAGTGNGLFMAAGAGSSRGTGARQSGQRSEMRVPSAVRGGNSKPQAVQWLTNRWPGGDRVLLQRRQTSEALCPDGKIG